MNALLLNIIWVYIMILSPKDDIISISYTKQKRYSVEEYIEKYVKSDNPAMLKSIRATYDKVRTDYVLVQQGLTSDFYDPDYIDSETGQREVIGDKDGKKYTSTQLDVKNHYFNDFSSNTFMARLHSRSTTHMIKDKIPRLEWTLGTDQRTILGYPCKNATIASYKGFDVEAWYTPEIPISNGPLEYGGLPGMILELNFASFKYTAKEIHMNAKNIHLPAPQIRIDDKDQPISWEDYINIYYR